MEKRTENFSKTQTGFLPIGYVMYKEHARDSSDSTTAGMKKQEKQAEFGGHNEMIRMRVNNLRYNKLAIRLS